MGNNSRHEKRLLRIPVVAAKSQQSNRRHPKKSDSGLGHAWSVDTSGTFYLRMIPVPHFFERVSGCVVGSDGWGKG